MQWGGQWAVDALTFTLQGCGCGRLPRRRPELGGVWWGTGVRAAVRRHLDVRER